MPDTTAILRLLDELLWTLRRRGVAVSTAQAIDAVRAVRLVGVEERDAVRDALAAVLCTHARDRAVFGASFEHFFGARAARTTLVDRLRAAGFTAEELAALWPLLGELGEASRVSALLDRGVELDALLAVGAAHRATLPMTGSLTSGFFAQRALEASGVSVARGSISALRLALRDALGARGDALADAVEREIEAGAREVRDHVRALAAERERPELAPGVMGRALATLDPLELDEVRRAVRSLAARLEGRERVRRRRARRGRIDPHATLRGALRSAGVPFALPRRRRRADRPELVLLCDVSDSVRRVANFLLEFVHVAHELFERTRSFVFVSDLGETTELFEHEPPEVALSRAWSGAVVPVTANSNYGRALSAFVRRHLSDVERHTTVVVLGDGRTNWHADGADALDAIRARAKALVWLCPEPRAAWGAGDSAMNRYAERCTEVLTVATARELEAAARRLALRR